MGKKLYIGNLPFSSGEDELRDLFGQVGAVDSVKLITDRDTGRSKGFAFVEMSTDEDAAAAIERYNGTELAGRPLTVSEARPMQPRTGGFGGGDRAPRGGGFGGGFGGGGRRGGSRHADY